MTTIRKAIRADIQAVRDLVVELAVYEKEPDAVTATLEDYLRDFDANWFESIVAEQNGEIVGMMIYYNTYSTWKGRMLYLEDFVVKSTHRRTGIGHLLFDELFKIAKEKKAVMMKWQVLDWNEPAINFYKKYNAVFDGEWFNCKVYFD